MGKRARIFVVEDHPTTARALKMYLETQGYGVTVAEDVASAVKAANGTPFDLLICDLNLPDGSGWDLMKKLKRNRRSIRAIAFTASGSAEDIIRSEQVGFMKHIMKGCASEELTQIIEETLNAPLKAKPVQASRVHKTAGT